MSATIMEALQNAKHNLVETNHAIGAMLGKDQLKNAVTLLEKGYSLYDEVEPLLEEYGSVENVPGKS